MGRSPIVSNTMGGHIDDDERGRQAPCFPDFYLSRARGIGCARIGVDAATAV